MFYKKGGGDIWSILTLNDVFFLGKMEKTRVAEGGFTYSHNIISIYHPKWWFFGEDQKCSWGPKMKNKPNFFFDNRGFPNWGGSATWKFFPHIPVFFWQRPLCQKILFDILRSVWWQSKDGSPSSFGRSIIATTLLLLTKPLSPPSAEFEQKRFPGKVVARKANTN